MLRTEIIQQFNEASVGEVFAFPHFSIFHAVDARLSVYRTTRSWAVVIETLIVNDQGAEAHEACHTMFFCYGDDLPHGPGITDPMLWVTSDGPSGPLFESQFDILVSPRATDMRVRGMVVPITTNPAEYAAAGIELRRPPRVLGYELLRLITPKYRRMFFATEAEIVQRIGEAMPLVLRLDEWHHPDRDEGEVPGDSETFQMIADVIAQNDPSLYQPTVPPNTHWRNWPMAGAI